MNSLNASIPSYIWHCCLSGQQRYSRLLQHFHKIAKNMGFMQTEIGAVLEQFPIIHENMDFMQEGQESNWMSNSERDTMYDTKSHSASNAMELDGNNDHDVLPEDMFTSKAMQEGQDSSWSSNSETGAACYAKSQSPCSSSETEGNSEHVVKPQHIQTSHSYRLKRLKSENKKLQNLMICKRCNCAQVQTLTLPCCHIVCCEPCADAVDNCPLCIARILGTVRIFMS
jgi:hypothetical protein